MRRTWCQVSGCGNRAQFQ
ncbi:MULTISPECIES: hypothetical protein [unclassified Marinobacter]